MSPSAPTPQDSDEPRIDLLLDLSTRLRAGAADDLDQALALATAFFGLSFGIVSRVAGDDYTVEVVHQPPGAGIEVGQRFPLGNTYCSITLAARDVVSIDEMASSAHKGHPCYGSFGLESYLGVPLIVEGEVYGTLNFSAPEPRAGAWTETDRQLVRLLARWVESSIAQRNLHRRLRDALEQLDGAHRELARKNEDLRAFVSMASHDLKEPLRTSGALVEFIREDAESLDTTTEGHLAMIEAATSRGLELIDDLLSYSSVSSQPCEHEPVDLTQVAGEVVEDLRARIRASRGQVDVGPLPSVRMDAVQARQLLHNLLGNALTYHRPGEPPRVSVRATELELDGRRTVELRVADEGIGIAPEHLERIFQPFRRLHARDEYDGTGMGLAICARIVEHHGGRISAESSSAGTTFVLTLPLDGNDQREHAA